MRLRAVMSATLLACFLPVTISAATQVDGAVVETDLVSVVAAGTSTGNGATPPEIPYGADAVLSADGRFVAFTSDATDLTSDVDANEAPDVFLWDRSTGEVTLVSRNAAGTGTPDGPSTAETMSDDGSIVVFRSQATDVTGHADRPWTWDQFVWDRATGEVTLLTESVTGDSTADGSSWGPKVQTTPDGSYVLFSSEATDLTDDRHPDQAMDAFLWERSSGRTTLVTRYADGTAAGGRHGAISDDGRYVALTSHAEGFSAEAEPSLGEAYLWDRTTREATLITRPRSPQLRSPDDSVMVRGMSGDGGTVLLEASAMDLTPEADEYGTYDVFAWQRATDTMTLISRSVDGVSTADGPSFSPEISHDGGVVSFKSLATDLTEDPDTNDLPDIYAWSRATGEVVLVSRQQDGSPAGTAAEPLSGGWSPDGTEPILGEHALSGNGEFVAFTSPNAAITGDPDDNGVEDVFRWERRTGEIVLVSTDQNGEASGTPGMLRTLPDVSTSGADLLFSSAATDITTHDDRPGTTDLFLARVIADACHPGEVPDAGFTDTAGSVHADAIDCLAWWELTRGKTEQRYAPYADVTRAQMASFLVRLAEAAQVEVPQDPPDRFDDDEGTPHELAINQLAELRVISGRDENTYDPHASVTRAEMAAFLFRIFEVTAIETLSSSTDHFTDDEQSGHEDAINAIAEAGFTTGVTARTFEPTKPVTRAQMASFLARLLDPLVTRGMAPPPG